MDDRIKKWEEAKRAVLEAIEWNDLPNGKRYQNDKFDISIAHCKPPMLSRMGQQSVGGKVYWETEPYFNDAILEYLIKDWDFHYHKILEILKTKESEALKELQSYVDEIQTLIKKGQE